MTLNEIGKEALAVTISKGFLQGSEDELPKQLLLMHSEISEACEADRKNKYTSESINIKGALESIPDDKFTEWYDTYVKGNFEEEIADLLIRNVMFSAYKKIDLELHVAAKMRYNKLRPHKHGGKKY